MPFQKQMMAMCSEYLEVLLCVKPTCRWRENTPAESIDTKCANMLSAYNHFWQNLRTDNINSSKLRIFGFGQNTTRSLLAFGWLGLIPITVRQVLTLKCSWWHYVLVHVIHVVGHEVLGCAAGAYEAGVQVEGRGQRGQAWVIDQREAC